MRIVVGESKNIIYNDLWFRKSSGFLIPLFSIRSGNSLGIGDIGDMHRLIDWTTDHGQSVIQLLPLNDTSPADPSPYAAISAFAVNPLYIHIPDVKEVTRSVNARRILDEWETDGTIDTLRQSDKVDYPAVRAVKMALLSEGFQIFMQEEWKKKSRKAKSLARFMKSEKWWLRDYVLFTLLKEKFKNRCWRDWPERFSRREKDALTDFENENFERGLFFCWMQWLFIEQWKRMRRYAHEKGVYIMGDIAFYPSFDSVEVWSRPEIFQIDEELRLCATSGAPPDYFNPDGQDWGTPLYDWDRMREDGFSWWLKRVERVCEFFDLYRLDHFRGFESYWRVPAGKKASEGKWIKGPGELLLNKILNISLYERLIIPLAEDLGDISPEVHALRRRLGIAGYKTFIFGWGEGEESGLASGYRYPEEYEKDFLATTGTHDTPTMSQWWKELREDEKKALTEYLSLPQDASHNDLREALFDKLFFSDALFLVIPFQDMLGLGPEHRINVPGTFGEHNWTWRMPFAVEELFKRKNVELNCICDGLKSLAAASGRGGRGQGAESAGIVGVLPSSESVQVRSAGDTFVVWAAVAGNPEKVTLLSDILDKKVELHRVFDFSVNIKLYKGEFTANRQGIFSFAIRADGQEIDSNASLRMM